MNKKAVSLLSGGLDSLLATKVLLDQGIEVVGLHFTSPLCNAIKDDNGDRAIAAGRELGIRVIVRDKGEAYLDVVRHPKHGHGKNMNPCIDCRIYMLQLTHHIMVEEGASFIVTGEVLGQRPMSQQNRTIHLIERESGLDGIIVRPLSAKLFEPTLPEKEGIVDRERLFDINGRSRNAQLKMVEQYGLTRYADPGGGCLLTDRIYSIKLSELFASGDVYTMIDIGFLRVGKHFRIDGMKLILGRNQAECEYLESCCLPPYRLLEPENFTGPAGMVKGEMTESQLRTTAAIMAFFGKCEASPIISETYNGTTVFHNIEHMAVDPEIYRIGEKQ